MTFHQRHLSIDRPFGLAPFIGAEAKRSLGAIQPKLDNSKRPIVMRGTVSGGSGYVRSVILSSCGIAYRENDTTASLDEEHFWDTTGRLVPWRVDRDWLREARLRLKLHGTVRSAFTQDFELRGIRLSDLTQPAWSDRGWTDAGQGSAQNRP